MTTSQLTIPETAELLNVSPLHLIKLLEHGELPFHRVGMSRRIQLVDILAYKRKSFEEREAMLREMVALNQEMGLYD